MTPRERVLAALHHEVFDRVPRFEIWIDACYEALGCADPVGVYAAAGQDCVMMPSRPLPGSNAWGTGVDEWGRIWRDGTYVGGAIETLDDVRRYSPPLDDAMKRFDVDAVRRARVAYPDHCLIFGTHIGPFTAAYMAMGFEHFFLRLMDDPDFMRRLLEVRTEWCLAVYQRAVELGAEVLVLGDDVGSTHGPMIPPAVWREMVLPLHRRIVEALNVPVIWHSDGNVEVLLPMAVEAGFAGVHGLDPIAGMDLGHIKRAFGQDLALVGNIDVRVLCGDDSGKVRAEVDRCLAEGVPGGGYLLATCNSIFEGLAPAMVAEYFRYGAERVGG